MATARETTAPQTMEERRAAIRSVREKRAFWRHVSLYSVLNLAFWVSWIIGGLNEEWVAPWPLIPTVAWGLFILYRERLLGGRKAISHETIDLEVDRLQHPDVPVYRDRLARRPVAFSDSAAFRPLRPFHLQDVIDARELKAKESTDPASSNRETSGAS